MTRSKAMRNEPAVVFYVDDNPRSRRLLTSVLEDSGFDVVTADSGIKALGMCKNISFDVALLDYQMPLISGGSLLRK
jgi:CheY-like chemotaxis protein